MLSKYGRGIASGPAERIVRRLQTLGMTPNGLTYTGFGLTVLTAVLLAFGQLRWGALLLAVASVFDMLDGTLARVTGQTSVFGAFIDSTLDRYSESVILLALAYHYSRTTATRSELILVFVIIVGSLMVSYTRARAEGLDLKVSGGWLQRSERVVLLILGLLTGWMQPVLWIMAIFTNVSAIQRIYEVYGQTNQTKSEVAHPPPGDNRPA